VWIFPKNAGFIFRSRGRRLIPDSLTPKLPRIKTNISAYVYTYSIIG